MNETKLHFDITSVWKHYTQKNISDVNVYTKLLHHKLSSYIPEIQNRMPKIEEEIKFLLSNLRTTQFINYDDFDSWMKAFCTFCYDNKISIKLI